MGNLSMAPFEVSDMMDRILVPVDGSELAARVLPFADAYAGGLQAEIELVYVVLPDIRTESLEAEVEMNRRFMPPRPEEAEVEHRLEERIDREAAAAAITLERAQGSLSQATSVVTTILRGEPDDAIVEHALDVKARLVAMATHARQGLERAVLGSVASAVLQRSHAPVLLINPMLHASPRLPQRILVALDGSPLADTILPAVMPLAERFGSTLVLFNVEQLPPPTVPVQGAVIPLAPPAPRPPAAVAEHLEEIATRVREQGLDAEIAIGPEGDRARIIARSALEQGCDLIAMSTHGHHGIGRLLHGSVTDSVVRQAEVPVLAMCPAEVRQSRPAS